MDFSAALKAMKEGKKVRRTSWPAGTYSIHGTKEQYGYDTFIVHCVKEDGSFSDERFTFLNGDIFAEDWEIVEDIPEMAYKYEIFVNGKSKGFVEGTEKDGYVIVQIPKEITEECGDGKISYVGVNIDDE